MYGLNFSKKLWMNFILKKVNKAIKLIKTMETVKRLWEERKMTSWSTGDRTVKLFCKLL